MADEKKSGGETMPLGTMLFATLAVLFIMWLISGGPSRIENKYNPGLLPPETPFDTFEIYGEGGEFQQTVENILSGGTHDGWSIQGDTQVAFLTPPGWTTVEEQTFGPMRYGQITNGTVTLLYQYGPDANPLDFENNLNYQVEYGVVNKRWTRFVKPRTQNAETTGAFIKRSKKKRITIYTNETLTEEETKQVFEIINTVKI